MRFDAKRYLVGLRIGALLLAQSAHSAYALVMLHAQRLACALAADAPDIGIKVRSASLSDLFAAHRANLSEEIVAVLLTHRHTATLGVFRASAWTSAPRLRLGLLCHYFGYYGLSLSRLPSFRRHGRPFFLANSAAKEHRGDDIEWLTLQA